MKRTNLRKATGIAALALTASFGLAACGSDDSSAKAADDSMGSSASASADDAGAQTFGPGCSAIPASGDGSFNGMATAPVASAASANPLLKTLVAAVTKAGLVDTLNSADALTVFAPTDDAFAKIPAATLNKVLADKATLTAILTHHVLAGQMDPSAIVGTHDTLNKDQVTVSGDTNGMTVDNGDTPANVLCGNIPTSNATVYVIDSVLMPS
ncbi:putative surface protein with fasciclin (FAS1) repeats [Nocardioides ginsengisegetis]|uniref:Putative surface protein with fasciclin (FAS1) repeats n=1 Tax=Nocardioides ginsengisegetis TaxID=661491 RepID=A0A7W3J3V3_9ACTN|nr:fasciclin domain-containing protein [Nocardioides ginsengisegetis]MBA8805821.1 putative surface protein with fasciclin (FAS1) repeats [Nocardioides ginsengisegetis]